MVINNPTILAGTVVAPELADSYFYLQVAGANHPVKLWCVRANKPRIGEFVICNVAVSVGGIRENKTSHRLLARIIEMSKLPTIDVRGVLEEAKESTWLLSQTTNKKPLIEIRLQQSLKPKPDLIGAMLVITCKMEVAENGDVVLIMRDLPQYVDHTNPEIAERLSVNPTRSK